MKKKLKLYVMRFFISGGSPWLFISRLLRARLELLFRAGTKQVHWLYEAFMGCRKTLHMLINITGSNGANLSFPLALGIGSKSTRDTFLVGLINAAPYIGSAFLGCWASDPLNSKEH